MVYYLCFYRIYFYNGGDRSFPPTGFNQQMRIEHNKSIRFDVVDIPITADPLMHTLSGSLNI